MVELFDLKLLSHCTHNSYIHTPQSLQILLTGRPEAVVYEHSEDTTKNMRVYKI